MFNRERCACPAAAAVASWADFPFRPMDKKLSRTLGVFAVFFAFALPLFSALAGVAAHRPLVSMLAEKGRVSHPLAEFYFNRFPVAVALPVMLGVVCATAAWRRMRSAEQDPVGALGSLFLIQGVAAMGALLWLALYLVAAAMA